MRLALGLGLGIQRNSGKPTPTGGLIALGSVTIACASAVTSGALLHLDYLGEVEISCTSTLTVSTPNRRRDLGEVLIATFMAISPGTLDRKRALESISIDAFAAISPGQIARKRVLGSVSIAATAAITPGTLDRKRSLGDTTIASAATVTPAALLYSLPTTNLVIWLRADLGRTMNGSTVSQWANQSGSGRFSTEPAQATGSRQPLYVAGPPAELTFDGVSVGPDRLGGNYGTNMSATASAYFVVARKRASTGNVMFILDGAINDLLFRHVITIANADNKVSGYGGTSVTPTGSVTNGTTFQVALLLGASATKVRLNRDASTASGAAGSQVSKGMTIGAYQQSDTNTGLDGNIYEILGYAADMTQNEYEAVERYLQQQYGLP